LQVANVLNLGIAQKPRENMKYLRSITLFALLLAIGLPIVASAQPVSVPKMDTAIAFVTIERTQLWVKRSDTAAYVVFKADPNNFISINNLAYLDQTRDGKTLLLAGRFHFIPPWNQSAAIDWTGAISVPTDSIGSRAVLNSVKFLKTAPYTTIRPLGVIAGDRKWFVAFNSIAANAAPPLKFYRGSLDSSYNAGGGTADLGLEIVSIGPTGSDIPSNWRLSNISVSADGSHMIAAATQEPEVPTSWKLYLYYWNLTAAGGPQWYVDNLKNYNALLPQKNYSPDTLYAFSVRLVDGDNAELGLVNVNGNANIQYYRYRYTGFSGLTPDGRSIKRSEIPSTEYFFSGANNSVFQEHLLTNSVGQHGLGGDIMFSEWNSDKAVFITHESAPEQSQATRDTLSEIYTYDFTTNTAKKVYNNLTNQELQPQFMLIKGLEWHYPVLSTGTSQKFTFSQTDSGKATASKSFTLSSIDPVATSLVIDSIVLTNGTNFQLTGGTKTATTLSAGSPITLSAIFRPIDPTAGPKSDTIRVYWNDSAKEVLSFPMSGTENIPPPPPPKSVHEEDPAVFAMSVQPNPFAASASISLTAPEAGSIGIIVHDALGREVYASQSVKSAAGQSHEFTFDAKSLGLPAGTYYVTALLGDRAATRQVVFVK
jgi:hypothetical protein